MTWFKVDDSFHSHPKVLATGPAALGLWVIAGAWSSANLTDGFVPDRALPRLLPDSAPLAEELVANGLWRRAKGGYLFHDWRDFNPLAEDVKAEREAARERMRKLRADRKTADSKHDRSGEHRRTNDERSGDVRNPVPSRPVQSPKGTRTDTGSQSSSRRNAHATGPDDDDSIDLHVVELLTELTGHEISIRWAAKVRQQILDGRTVKRRMAYVAQAIHDNPAKFAPPTDAVDPGPSLKVVPPLPPWCGFCHADDYRWIETADGRWAKCRECNPDAAKEAS